MKEAINGKGKFFGSLRNNREEDEKKTFDKKDGEADGEIVEKALGLRAGLAGVEVGLSQCPQKEKAPNEEERR